ncbi:hypothetical protein ABIE78_000025 [Sinorhizobium fredii]|uniref:Uncharacterized protein n=3 Tax=Sinorhizobium TaxID=28105 RepID=I3XGA2_SINF2|nr:MULTISPECIES: hypothetical protein [Sinorhizobium]AFL54908.1 hypothetical protein USDA257_p01930 [Sinorhizobium fredii USDA 257]KSV90128.1 hypothetical protein N181_13020 [Sinorhizobium fredii USDA 205]MQX07577.1 hypothetical protein [Sinorhizobium fredii]OAP35563.1 hypothetical protein AU381_11645 [Sinorhizobium glycinis]CCE99188.1 hypothetical protein SFHH103_04715 [Sinorhizobium fredii HH103]
MTGVVTEKSAPNAANAGLVMKFLELDGQNGQPPRSVSIGGLELEPLNYDQLAGAQLHRPLSVPLNWRHARILETNIEGIEIDSLARGNATLESTHNSMAVSLQRGGWLPSGLAIADGGVTILPDRNVISQIKGRFEGGSVVGAGQDFLDLLAEQEVRLNPLLFAIEGNDRRIPDHQIVEAQLTEVTAFLRKALPKAELVVGNDSLRGALGLIEDTRAGLERKSKFLLHLSPVLTAPTSRRLFDKRWTDVLDAADRYGVARGSLVVLAALSSVAVPNSGSPAKKMLKFRATYSDEDAYNALADIRSLEILIHLLALFPGERPAIFTADRALALFWTGIRAHNFRREMRSVSCDLAPVEQLFPGDTMNLWKSDCRPRAAAQAT